jgi:hypothetical protein
MRVEVVENDGRRLRLALRTNVPLYAFFALMFIGLGICCIWLLAVRVWLAGGEPIAGLLLGLVCIGSGVLIALAIQRVDLVADREAGTINITRRLLLWPTSGKHELRVADIQAVPVVARTLRTGLHIVTSHSVRLQARGQDPDKAVSLTFLPMFTERAANDVAQLIRAWLHAG